MLRHALLMLLAVALLHAQSLGLLHRQAHQPHAPHAAAAALPAVAGHAEAAEASALFAHDEGDATCRLLDGLLASAPGSEPLSAVAAPACSTPPHPASAAILPAERAPFQARGPPLHS